MRKESVLELKNEVLKTLWSRSGQQRGAVAQTQGLVNPYVESRLAVGYSQRQKGSYRLELRVQRPDGAAYQLAEDFKEKARQEANIEVVPSIEIPSQRAVLNVAGHKGLTHRKDVNNDEPIHIGLSIGHAEDGAGTLGAFVSDSDGKECILSNNHVLALMGAAALKDAIYQPGRPDQKFIQARTEIAFLSNYCVINKNARDSIDAAVATLKKGVSHESNRIPVGLRFPMEGKMIRQVESAEHLIDLLRTDSSVCKIGRTTGLTEGRVGAVALDNVTVKTSIGNVVFDNVIEINWKSNKTPFSRPGDSGSLVFTKNGLWAVGLHFAGGVKKLQQRTIGVSYSGNMTTILDTMELSWLD
ncbi:MAG: hypothetical protein ACRD9S_22060 [Pyrinomonadaceae bacterium]